MEEGAVVNHDHDTTDGRLEPLSRTLCPEAVTELRRWPLTDAVMHGLIVRLQGRSHHRRLTEWLLFHRPSWMCFCAEHVAADLGVICAGSEAVKKGSLDL